MPTRWIEMPTRWKEMPTRWIEMLTLAVEVIIDPCHGYGRVLSRGQCYPKWDST
jgi:hypothetical protein